MLRGDKVGLRARRESDIPVLMAELYDDVAMRSRADGRPWVPLTSNAASSPFRVDDAPDSAVCFSVVALDTDELAGDALLWNLDLHNRLAHVGISLLPRARGRGYAEDVLRVLCRYAFATRGLHRLQLETHPDNEPMRRAALAVGFELEATLREAAWVDGGFADEVAYGLLASEWSASS